MRSLDKVSVRRIPAAAGAVCCEKDCQRVSKYHGPNNDPMCWLHFRKWRKANDLPDRICAVCAQSFRPTGQKLTCSNECARTWRNNWRRRMKETGKGKQKIAQDQKRLRDSDAFRAKRREYEKRDSVKENRANAERERLKRPELKLRKKTRDFIRQNAPDVKARMRALRTKYIQTPNGKESVKRGYRKRRARIRNVEHVPYSTHAIFRRDKFTCQLCGDPISKRATWPHPLSASIDHIVPVSLGGPDAPHNVQCSHLRCNLRKSAIPLGQMIFEGFGT